MGFTSSQSKIALRRTDNDINRAADYLFSHDLASLSEEPIAAAVQDTDDVMSVDFDSSNANNASTNQLDDGPGTYKLAAFISHMGKSAHVGHYVVHIKNRETGIYV